MNREARERIVTAEVKKLELRQAMERAARRPGGPAPSGSPAEAAPRSHADRAGQCRTPREM